MTLAERNAMELQPFPESPFLGDDGKSLYGSCSHCQRRVDNHDELHRVTSIVRGGRGVECVLRGDITYADAMPLGRHNR